MKRPPGARGPNRSFSEHRLFIGRVEARFELSSKILWRPTFECPPDELDKYRWKWRGRALRRARLCYT